MRGVETRIQEIRHRIFREVARMAYHTEWPVDKRIEELPYKIIPGEEGSDFCHRLVDHGREVCTARTKPYCDRCCLNDICAKHL